jgi:hypothetical protein
MQKRRSEFADSLDRLAEKKGMSAPSIGTSTSSRITQARKSKKYAVNGRK